jgi:hypothetical protein
VPGLGGVFLCRGKRLESPTNLGEPPAPLPDSTRQLLELIVNSGRKSVDSRSLGYKLCEQEKHPKFTLSFAIQLAEQET